mmetsp:Transcript_70210/g.138024  ORF Transcript_70210/g.138024 Transcript_70210/m.138024 type:complete len:102 (-) Transcript_70210:372-677(-)
MQAAQEASKKLQEAFSSADDDLTKRRIKPLQKLAYLCMAKCCDSDASKQALQQCMQNCNAPVEHAGKVYQGETQRFQERYQRAGQSCQDAAQDLVRKVCNF